MVIVYLNDFFRKSFYLSKKPDIIKEAIIMEATMDMIEYPAMIYKHNRNRGYIANCLVKNLVGFGKTEEDALNNLKKCLKDVDSQSEIKITPIYGLSL